MMRSVPQRLLLLAVALHVSAGAVSGQSVEESRLLRDASARESRGDFEGAEEVLRTLLRASPTSSGGLFALERVLRSRGETRDLLPAVDTFLAHDPASAGVRYLKLRVLMELDSLTALKDEAERWLRLQPTSEVPYREVARVYERAFGPAPALEVLRQGRVALGRPDVLALEIGDLLVALGEMDPALAEWARAVGDDGGQTPVVSKRVAGLLEAPEDAARTLVGHLVKAKETGRRRAAVLIALDMRLGPEALDCARRLASDLEERQRTSFLADVARRARDAGLGDVASWAYGELGQEAGSPAERRQFDQRLVEVSLAAGDTVAALEAQRRVMDSYTLGSADRRRASAQVIRLEGASAAPERLRELLDGFRETFPEAPELDELTAAVAGALLGRGDAEGAGAVLEGMAGPRSSLQRGYLLLAAGEVGEARRAFLMSLPGLDPSDATGVIQFVGLLGRLSPPSGVLLARAGAMAHEGRGVEAATALVQGLGDVPEDDRAALLAEAARMADQVEASQEGARFRAQILEEYPDSPEVGEAALVLARFHARTPSGRAEAIRLLEQLVTERPNAAVVPDARRELERLRRAS
ncbi:MAG TPA: hypothetical protein VLA36_09540 [Longimicrobiales bacterium]|nr:hypothetical protein [Longimicrobiales bacterium]